jgi:hypothetical protein
MPSEERLNMDKAYLKGIAVVAAAAGGPNLLGVSGSGSGLGGAVVVILISPRALASLTVGVPRCRHSSSRGPCCSADRSELRRWSQDRESRRRGGGLPGTMRRVLVPARSSAR